MDVYDLSRKIIKQPNFSLFYQKHCPLHKHQSTPISTFSDPNHNRTRITSIIRPHNFVVVTILFLYHPGGGGGGTSYPQGKGVVSRVISSPGGLSVPHLCLLINPGSTNNLVRGCLKLSRIFGFGRIELQLIVTSCVR